MNVLMKPLSRLNAKNSNLSKHPEQDLNNVFQFMEDSKSNLSGKVVNAFMEEARHVGSALLVMVSWYQCSKYVIDNPKFTKKFVSSRNMDLKRFRKDPSRKQFVKDTINSFLRCQTNKSKVVTKNYSKCKYLQLLATEDGESDMDDDTQPITKENLNETDNEEYTSSDDTNVSSEENTSDNKSSHDDKIPKETVKVKR